MDALIKKLHFNEKGLIPAIIQDEKTGTVLTLCYMNDEALTRTFKEGKIYVFRRSKGKLMMKGGTSGHVQVVKKVYVDCEENSLLFKVEQKVAGCHAGYFTCYFRTIDERGTMTVIEKQVFNPEEKYK
jgi:phosphoribosyl-AMP cyclohydrolase